MRFKTKKMIISKIHIPPETFPVGFKLHPINSLHNYTSKMGLKGGDSKTTTFRLDDPPNIKFELKLN